MCHQLRRALPMCHWAGVLPTQVLLFVIKGLGDMKGRVRESTCVGLALADWVAP